MIVQNVIKFSFTVHEIGGIYLQAITIKCKVRGHTEVFFYFQDPVSNFMISIQFGMGTFDLWNNHK